MILSQATQAVRERGGIAIFALIEQALVGGAGIMTSMLVGRICGKTALGQFTLGMTILLLLLAAQESLITAPYTIFKSRLPKADLKRYAGGVLAHALLVGAVVATVLLILVVLPSPWEVMTQLKPVLAVLVLAIPTRLIREFARRYEYADLRSDRALLLGITVLTVQVGALALLGVSGHLNAATAFGAMALASGLASIHWYRKRKGNFAWSRSDMKVSFARNWNTGRWMFAGQTTGVLSTFALPWMVAALLTQEDAGLYGACVVAGCLANPLVMAFSNLLMPGIATVYSTRGAQAVHGLVKQATLFIAVFMIAFAMIMAFGGGWLVTLIFGESFLGQDAVVFRVVLAQVFLCLAMACSRALNVFERSELEFFAQLCGFVTTMIASFLLIPRQGILGAATAFLLGMIVASVITILLYSLVYQRKLRESPHDAAANGVQIDSRFEPSNSASSGIEDESLITEPMSSASTHDEAEPSAVPVTEGRV